MTETDQTLVRPMPDIPGAVEQIVGRERNQRACHRQLDRNVVVARRVNSNVMPQETLCTYG